MDFTLKIIFFKGNVGMVGRDINTNVSNIFMNLKTTQEWGKCVNQLEEH
jgi:hypothetical protein